MAQALVAFFAIIDPIGNILVFHLLTRGLDFRERLLSAAVAVSAAFGLLLAFSLGGSDALDFLGIGNDSFKIAAGLLLLPPAYRLVMEGEPGRLEDGDGERRDVFDFALVPLATPLIAGPGALAAATSFAQSSGQATTVAAFTIVLVATFVSFLVADQVFRLLGQSVLKLSARLVGIVLFAIAVDFVLEGIRDFFQIQT